MGVFNVVRSRVQRYTWELETAGSVVKMGKYLYVSGMRAPCGVSLHGCALWRNAAGRAVGVKTCRPVLLLCLP